MRGGELEAASHTTLRCVASRHPLATPSASIATTPSAASTESRLAVDAGLGVVAMDADGVASGWRLATHLSVV